MSSKLLALLAALAVGGTTGAVAFTSARGEAPPPLPQPSVALDPCADPASRAPECVVVVPVPAPAGASVDAPAVAPAPAPVQAGGSGKRRGDGSLDDSGGAPDDDRSGRRGGQERGRDDDRDDDEPDDDDGTPDQGSGDR